jgi:polyisoprenoid-binding protein YceI
MMHRFLNLQVGLVVGLIALPWFAHGETFRVLKGESKISYHLHHPMHEINGVSQDFDCSVILSGDTVRSQIQVRARVASFNSGNSNRDSHMLEMLDGLKYPFVEFTSDSLRHEGKDYRVFGQLTFHGIKHPLIFLVTPTYLKDKAEIKGGFTILLSDYKVERPSLLFVPTAEDLHIDLDVWIAEP